MTPSCNVNVPLLFRSESVAILMVNIKQFIISHMLLYSRKPIILFMLLANLFL